MIDFSEALKLVQNTSLNPTKEKVGFAESLNRVLAQDVVADINMPPFNKSAVDGYACLWGDLNNELEILETIPAGKMPEKKLAPGYCSKIMTGAPVPEGTDCVVMVEQTEVLSNGKIKILNQNSPRNICLLGEDIKKSDVLITAGTVIKPQHIAVMASVGCIKPMVYSRPKIAVISTGNELVEPDVFPTKSQIRNSNGYQLISQIIAAGAVPSYQGIIPDSEDDTFSAINKASIMNNVILLTGGVSMGDYDFVPDVLVKSGFEIVFKSIKVQPGKPTVFAKKDSVFCFGLPGNPVSAFIQFEMLVKPLLSKISGQNQIQHNLLLPLGQDITRKPGDRLNIVPIMITDGQVFKLDYHGSAHINSLIGCNGFIFIEPEFTVLKQGSMVHVRQI